MRIVKTISTDYKGDRGECPICKGHTGLVAQDMGRHKYMNCVESGCGIFRFSDNDMGQSQITVELVDDLFIIT